MSIFLETLEHVDIKIIHKKLEDLSRFSIKASKF